MPLRSRLIPACWLLGPLVLGGCSGDGASSSTQGPETSGNASAVAGAAPSAGGGAQAGSGAAGGGAEPRGGATTGGTSGGSSSNGGVSESGAGTGAAGASAGTTGGGAGGTTSTGGVSGTAGAPAGSDDGNLIPLLAFPGAQGFGKNATGGRNGTVYHVTNLNDSGAGSFRDAVGTGNRIVVFDVGGYIQLTSAVLVKSNITIAGQTAPGEGIGFRGGELSFAKQQNIIMRFVRIRPGSETESTEDDALSLYRARNVAIDHSSFEFAPWNNIDGVSDDWQNSPVTDITFQDCIIADPTGQQFGAHTESVASNWAWYRNIFANSHNRNPLAKANTVFVNNLLYNYSAGYTTHTSTEFKHDIVNNYFVFGPASTGTDNTWFQVDKNQTIFYSGNLKDTNRNGALDGAETTPYWYQGTGTIAQAAWSSETAASAALDAPSAARVALSQAGPLPRDALDALIIGQALTLGKGSTGLGAGTVGPDSSLYTSQAQTGLPSNGYGNIQGGTRAADADDDGMSDAWEKATGSDPSADDAMKKAPDGYTLIEHYLDWLARPHATSSAGAATDVDLAAYTAGFSGVTPIFTVTDGSHGTVTLAGDGHTARFQPTPGFQGRGNFTFRVKGADNTSFTSRVTVLVTP